MATFADIKIKMERRPCVVLMNGEEVQAMFHTWYNGNALIELENGAVHLYSIENGSLVFLDHFDIKDYDCRVKEKPEADCVTCEYLNVDELDEPCFSCKLGRGEEDRYEPYSRK